MTNQPKFKSEKYQQRYDQLSAMSEKLYSELKAGNREHLLNVLKVISITPSLTVRNALVLYQQLGKAPMGLKTPAEWKKLNVSIKKGNRWLWLWEPQFYDDLKTGKKVKGRILPSARIDISQTNAVKPDRMDLFKVEQALIDKYGISIWNGRTTEPALKVPNTTQIVVNSDFSKKQILEAAAGQILRVAQPQNKPLTLGAMLVFRCTGSDKMLRKEIDRNDSPASVELTDLKSIIGDYRKLVAECESLVKDLAKKLEKEESPPISIVDSDPEEDLPYEI
ncbi:MAG: hypothetical protein K6F49_11720 [Saccharofermentans sp.]|nr:hypothetical protein [Saccharofermentans sp.]